MSVTVLIKKTQEIMLALTRLVKKLAMPQKDGWH
jgi:hypothetical protein